MAVTRGLRRFSILLVILVLLAVAGGTAIWYGIRQYDAPGPLPASVAVVVPRGGSAAVAGALAAQGVVRDRLLFRAAVLGTWGRGRLHAAELEFPAHASLRQVLDILRHAKPVQHELTVPEGFTAAQIAALLDQNPLLAGPLTPPAEGSVLPQTYAYERGSTRAALLERMQAAMTRTLADVWTSRDPALALPDARALLTLASIVERETGVGEERARVAGVFVNRLRQAMRLQSDPTVVYAITHGARPLPSLSRADLATDSPYNTYLVAGLPPGPICSPGIAALTATAHPAPGPALYFVATGTGGHAFADTLPQHEANVARYRAVMAAKNGNAGEVPIPSQGLLGSDGPDAVPQGAAPALPPFQKGVVPPAVHAPHPAGHAPSHAHRRHHAH